MIKDKNSINETYKSYAFIEFFDLEDTNKALNALNKGEIKLREEILCGNYSTKTEDKNTNTYFDNNLNYHVKYISYNIYLFIQNNENNNDKLKEINMNYLDKEQKQKKEKIFNLQNSIEASKERQEERISSYDNYLNNNMNNKTEELKMKKLMV